MKIKSIFLSALAYSRRHLRNAKRSADKLFVAIAAIALSLAMALLAIAQPALPMTNDPSSPVSARKELSTQSSLHGNVISFEIAATDTQTEETVLAFQTDSYKVKVYRKGGQLYMNLYDKSNSYIHLNGAPAQIALPRSSGDKSTSYVNTTGKGKNYARINPNGNTELEIVSGDRTIYQKPGFDVVSASQTKPARQTNPAIQTSPASQAKKITSNSDKNSDVLSLFKIFILFFITLGPLKAIDPFVQLTRYTDANFRWRLAFRASLIATIVALLVALFGKNVLGTWQISIPSLTITAGSILFLVALQQIVQQYSPLAIKATPEKLSLAMAVDPLAFPVLLTPYGIAILIAIMAASNNTTSSVSIISMLLGIMLLNFLGMLAARPILKLVGMTTLQILGWVLAVLQGAIAIEIIVRGLQGLGVLPAITP